MLSKKLPPVAIENIISINSANFYYELKNAFKLI